MSGKKKQRKATGMVMDEVNENFREGQDEEAKINIVIGMPKINSISPQIFDHAAAPTQQQDQVPLDPPQQSAPQPEVLHSGRISLQRGIEKKFLEDCVNNSLTPSKSRMVKNTNVYERLYSEHADKLVKEKQFKYFNKATPSPRRAYSATSPPNPPRAYVDGKEWRKKREDAVEENIEENIKKCHPQINEASRRIAEKKGPTPDRLAFSEGGKIEKKPRNDLTLEERTKKEVDENGLTFVPHITTLNPAILASPAGSPSSATRSSTGGAAAAAGAGTGAAPSSSSISTPLPNKRATKAGETAGAGADGLGVDDAVDENEPFHIRLMKKGEKIKRRHEELRKRKEDEERNKNRSPKMDPRSVKLLPKDHKLAESCRGWVNKRLYGSDGARGASTERVRAASADSAARKSKSATRKSAGAATSRELTGSQTPRGTRRFGGESLGRSMWGDRGSWIGNKVVVETREEINGATQPEIFPQISPPVGDVEEWVENTYGVKRFIERSIQARRWKEEKPLFNKNRKYPREPTKIAEFNLSKSKRELELQKEEETFEA